MNAHRSIKRNRRRASRTATAVAVRRQRKAKPWRHNPTRKEALA